MGAKEWAGVGGREGRSGGGGAAATFTCTALRPALYLLHKIIK